MILQYLVFVRFEETNPDNTRPRINIDRSYYFFKALNLRNVHYSTKSMIVASLKFPFLNEAITPVMVMVSLPLLADFLVDSHRQSETMDTLRVNYRIS